MELPNKYINFFEYSDKATWKDTHNGKANSAIIQGWLISGIRCTQNSGANGWWCSAPHYGPHDKDWWRCSCGHTVDQKLDRCPVCREPKEKAVEVPK